MLNIRRILFPVDAELGDPAQQIAEYAQAAGVNLIMMPTRGCGVFRRFLIGSVTAKVLHDAKCPVWTSAHIADPNHANFLPYRSVLCAIDGGPESAELIAWAGKFAHDAGATLRLVYVLQGMKDFPSPKYRDELREKAKAQIESLEVGLGFRAPLSVVFGLVGDCVRAEAMARVADLVIVGRGAIRETLGGLRTHAFGVIGQSPCPVISV